MLLFFFSAGFAFNAPNKGFELATNRTPWESQQKALFDELADKMELFPRDYIWGVYFDEALPSLRVNGFFRNGAMLNRRYVLFCRSRELLEGFPSGI